MLRPRFAAVRGQRAELASFFAFYGVVPRASGQWAGMLDGSEGLRGRTLRNTMGGSLRGDHSGAAASFCTAGMVAQMYAPA